MKNTNLQKTLLSALFLSLGIVLPFFTSQIKEIGDTLLPMHIPVMLCGLICGSFFGFTVGIITPILRSILFSMPPLYPNSCWMSLELATYGFVIGLIFKWLKGKGIKEIYISLISAMLSGRIVWGIAKAALFGISGKSFTVMAFITGGFLDALPGIALQLILIPLIFKLTEKRI